MKHMRFQVRRSQISNSGHPLDTSNVVGKSFNAVTKEDHNEELMALPMTTTTNGDNREELSTSVSPLFVTMMSDISTKYDRKISIDTDGLALYEDENEHMPKVEQIIRSLSVYNPLQPGTNAVEKDSKKKSAKMGTFVGVFLPCIQNIFGVLFFIRLAWIVGTAGVFHSFFIVLLCCAVTFLTSISLSAIATNGMVPAGGPYYMISRNLGPELGGAVGILFYLGTTVAASMYILGAAEIFMLYIYPKSKIFDDTFICYRLYGTLILIMLSCIVVSGVKVVNKFALPTVFIVNLCILLSFGGVFVKISGSSKINYCMVGDRLANLKNYLDNHEGDRVACNITELTRVYCHNASFSSLNCDSHFYLMAVQNRIEKRPAIRGLRSSVIFENIDPKYADQHHLIVEYNESVTPPSMKESERIKKLYVFADVTSSFIILVGVFFPSVTGIMAGSNRSGNLKDASQSIPRGTIAATTISSVVYLAGAVLFGATLDGLFMRDKFGESAFGKLVIAELAVPHYMAVCVGSLVATMGAGMQSLTGAPRLLQAIAKDGVIPILGNFQRTDKRGEALLAILITVAICEIGVLIAVLESITALISQFFLMCYLGVNTACTLQSLMKAPSWRPRFKYYHWSLSMVGSILCIAVMFMSNWIFAVLTIIIGAVVYRYIEYRGAEKEWGDGLRGLGLSAARYALLNLEHRTLHTKNWRPQTLVFCKMAPDCNTIIHEHILAFVSQLKAGKGLTVIGTVLEGDFADLCDKAEHAKHVLNEAKGHYKIKGFSEVLVSKNKSEGITTLIQTSGLGCLKHNTVVFSWPEKWKENDSVDEFVDALRCSTAAKCAVLLIKNVDNFPDNEQKVTGIIDVWWIVHDGGMMILLPFLLKQHKVWRRTKLRIFTVAQIHDNSIKMKEDLRTFLYHLRIDAEVDVIEMHDKDISEYTYERTLRMMQRSEILRELGLSGREIRSEIQTSVVDAHHKASISPTTENTCFTTPRTATVSFNDTNKSEDDKMADERIRMIDEQEIGFNGNGTKSISKASTTPYDKKDSTTRQTAKLQNAPSFVGLHNYTVKRMNTAVKLNEMMRQRSQDSCLIFVNLPSPPRFGADDYYMEFIEALTEGLGNVVLVKGSGSEVVTIYS